MLLHFYQPPTQEQEITRSILESCYLPLLRLLSQKSEFGLTLNVSGSLLFQLKQMGANEFFSLLNDLIADGKIEIVTSVMYHPIMPLTPKDVLKRQIEKNNQILKDLLGMETTNGFFPPELAMDNKTLKLMDSKYIYLDGSSLEGKGPIVKYNNKYLLVNNHQICNLFRSYPEQLQTKTVTNLLKSEFVLTANDVELFGHHYKERLQVLGDLLDCPVVKFITVSEAVSKFGRGVPEVYEISDSTWQECAGFALWNKNLLQKEYLKLLELAHGLSDDDFLDRSYSSCYLYWLSNWPWWHPGLVEKGVENLVKSVKGNKTVEAVAQQFLDQMWNYHGSGHVEENYQKFNSLENKYLGI